MALTESNTRPFMQEALATLGGLGGRAHELATRLEERAKIAFGSPPEEPSDPVAQDHSTIAASMQTLFGDVDRALNRIEGAAARLEHFL